MSKKEWMRQNTKQSGQFPKMGVASSSLVFRSIENQWFAPTRAGHFLFQVKQG